MMEERSGQSVHGMMAGVDVAMEMAGLDGLWQLRIGVWESHQKVAGVGRGKES